MKKLLILLFSILISFNSFAEWKKVATDVYDDVYYVDFDSIRKIDGYVYFWELRDYFKVSQFGDLSSKTYYQVDCKLMRRKVLNDSYHTGQMGNGNISEYSNTPDNDWRYASPGSVRGYMLESVCGY